MNKQNIQKLLLFLTGLEQRIQDSFDFFKKITVIYKSGTKTYTATVLPGGGKKLSMNFNGVNETLEIGWLSARIAKAAGSYEGLLVTYEERGSTIFIEADDKNVKMSTKQNDKENLTKSHSEVSHIGNREYLIKVGQADELLREINILSSDGKIRNDMIRKYNQIDHFIELVKDLLEDLAGKYESLTVLDCGCGKSYLTFVLNYYIKEVMKKPCYFIGLDYSSGVIEASKKIAAKLGYNNMEFKTTDIRNYNSDKQIHLVISLHACDTATDQAIALALNNNVKAMVMVPCCHRELLSQYSYKPFEPILKQGVFKARLADILTDGMRSLYLEAMGYKVSAVEYISPLETPKNLMIRAEKTGGFSKKAMEEYNSLKMELNIQPALEKLVVNNLICNNLTSDLQQ